MIPYAVARGLSKEEAESLVKELVFFSHPNYTFHIEVVVRRAQEVRSTKGICPLCGDEEDLTWFRGEWRCRKCLCEEDEEAARIRIVSSNFGRVTGEGLNKVPINRDWLTDAEEAALKQWEAVHGKRKPSQRELDEMIRVVLSKQFRSKPTSHRDQRRSLIAEAVAGKMMRSKKS
jgi:ribosomal protein L37AE/L43A